MTFMSLTSSHLPGQESSHVEALHLQEHFIKLCTSTGLFTYLAALMDGREMTCTKTHLMTQASK